MVILNFLVVYFFFANSNSANKEILKAQNSLKNNEYWVIKKTIILGKCSVIWYYGLVIDWIVYYSTYNVGQLGRDLYWYL